MSHIPHIPSIITSRTTPNPRTKSM